MNDAIKNFLFGLFFGCGFCIAQAILQLLGSIIVHAGHM